jgi:hypothetical protein
MRVTFGLFLAIRRVCHFCLTNRLRGMANIRNLIKYIVEYKYAGVLSISEKRNERFPIDNFIKVKINKTDCTPMYLITLTY